MLIKNLRIKYQIGFLKSKKDYLSILDSTQAQHDWGVFSASSRQLLQQGNWRKKKHKSSEKFISTYVLKKADVKLKSVQKFLLCWLFPNHQNCWPKKTVFPQKIKSLKCLRSTDQSIQCYTVWDKHYKQDKTHFETWYESIFTVQSFKEKENNPKGHCTHYEWKLPSITWFIGKLQIPSAVSTPVILFCHNWSELLGEK